MPPQSPGNADGQGAGQGDELYAEPSQSDTNSESEADRILNESSPADRSEADRVMDDVLRETQRAISGKAALDILQRVAKRAGNDDITDVNTCEELVREIIKSRFQIGALPGDIPERVAENLLQDPQVTARLIKLWSEVRGHVG
jgi:hypothetical protein